MNEQKERDVAIQQRAKWKWGKIFKRSDQFILKHQLECLTLAMTKSLWYCTSYCLSNISCLSEHNVDVLWQRVIQFFVNTSPVVYMKRETVYLTLRGWSSSSEPWWVSEAELLDSPLTWTCLGAVWCSGSLWPGWGGGSGSGGTPAGTTACLYLPPEDRARTCVSEFGQCWNSSI